MVRAVLERLYVIRDWFSVQQNWAFYSSSLLVVYEGTPLEKLRQEPANARVAQSLSDMTLIDSRSTSTTAEDKTASSECLPPVESPLADVKMIDFAHVFPAPDGAKDDNYIFGLCKLIRYHEKLLDLWFESCDLLRDALCVKHFSVIVIFLCIWLKYKKLYCFIATFLFFLIDRSDPPGLLCTRPNWDPPIWQESLGFTLRSAVRLDPLLY